MKKDLRVCWSIGFNTGTIWVLENKAYSMSGVLSLLRETLGAFTLAREYLRSMSEDTIYINSAEELNELGIEGVLVDKDELDIIINKVA